jgi:hypothetical protein
MAKPNPPSSRSGSSARREHGKTFRYRDRTVELVDEPGHVHVKIDGEHLHAARVEPGSYHSHILMYQDFPTLESLARALVESEGTLWLPAGHPVGHALAPPRKRRGARTAKKKAVKTPRKAQRR